RTLAASGIGSFRKLLDVNAKAAPLKRNVTAEEVGNAAAFRCSDRASGITGEVLHVDAGVHMVALVGHLEEAAPPRLRRGAACYAAPPGSNKKRRQENLAAF